VCGSFAITSAQVDVWLRALATARGQHGCADVVRRYLNASMLHVRRPLHAPDAAHVAAVAGLQELFAWLCKALEARARHAGGIRRPIAGIGKRRLRWHLRCTC
jgi:hypothetical protein